MVQYNTPIIAMIRDKGKNAVTFEAPEGEKPFDKNYCRSHKIWLASEWFEERFSEIEEGVHSWETLHHMTAEDQEKYLLQRDDHKFWVSQSILDYKGTGVTESRNYYGAQAMNDLWDHTFTNWFHHKNWEGKPFQHASKFHGPNVLLMDYSGFFGHLPETCFRLLAGEI
mmetsp:Transcript_5642/g.7891  ORF Transcript_5642/g.7891 Transcript_5642/m.7891 type:complete len:169 (-) Transcript_5642:83-589(-)